MVSIITPTYNSANFISSTIESVLSQTFTQWEMIIIDDCSTDNTIDIIEDYATLDNRIRIIILSRNSGAGIARNMGIQSARNKYIAFLDSDDRWHPDKLEKQVEFMETSQVACSFTDYYIHDINQSIFYKFHLNSVSYSYFDVLIYNRLGCSTVMINVEKTGKVLMPEIRSRQDWGFWISILKNSEPARRIPEYLTYYSRRSGSISTKKTKLSRYHWFIYRKYLKFNLLASIILFTANMAFHIYFHIKKKYFLQKA